MQKGLCTDKPGVGGPDLFPYKRVLSIPKHQKTVPASLICLFHYYMLLRIDGWFRYFYWVYGGVIVFDEQDEEEDLALSEIERVRCTY